MRTSPFQPLELGHLGLGLVHLAQQPFGVAAEDLSLRGEAHAAVLPVKQPQIELLLQLGDGHADGRLGHVQPLGRPGEGAGIAHRQQVSELFQVHINFIYQGDNLNILYLYVSSHYPAQKSSGQLHMIEIGSREWIRATLALSLGSFWYSSISTRPIPCCRSLAEVFSVSALSASWTLAGCTAGLAGSLLVCARLADRFGRRRIMLWTLAAAILLSLCIPWVTHFDVLVSLRILQGVLLAGLPATAIAYMGEEFSKRALIVAVGVYIAANSTGGIAGRVVGGLLAGWFGDWQHTFLGIGIISLALLPLVIWLLPAQRCFVAVEAAPGQLRRAIQSHLGNPLLVGAYLIGGLNFMVFLNQYSYLTFLLAKAPFSLPTQWLGMLFLTYLTGTVASSLSGRGAHRWGAHRLLLAGITLMALGSLALLQGSLVAIIGDCLSRASASSGPRLCQRLGRPARGAQPGARLVALSGGVLPGGQPGRALSASLLGARGLWGLVLGIELVLMITAGLSLWLGHLKGRVAPACALTPQDQAPVNGSFPHRPS